MNLQTLVVHTPPLCRSCYCRREAEICSNWDVKINHYENEFSKSTQNLKTAQKQLKTLEERDHRGANVMLLQRQRDEIAYLEGKIEHSNKDIRKVKTEKSEDLGRFREQMGVWGDG
ncbi:MAG: hypothetical protein Q9191_000035 [Dirinaria sp. TL-2023a]